MKVSEVMSPNVSLLDASATAYEAAKMLKQRDIGVVPVAKGDRLIGVVTDRDIVVRVIAEGRQAQQVKLEDIASSEPKYCFDDEECSHVAANMDHLLIRRLPVVNRDKRLVGIVSIDDIRPRQKAA
jgi:CBS domain-containing protein